MLWLAFTQHRNAECLNRATAKQGDSRAQAARAELGGHVHHSGGGQQEGRLRDERILGPSRHCDRVWETSRVGSIAGA